MPTNYTVGGQDLVNARRTAATLLYSGGWNPQVDPTEAARGTLFMQQIVGGAAAYFVKMDDGLTTNWQAITIGGGGGGGGTQIPVVLVDPVAPALNEQWILRTPEVIGVGIAGIMSGGPVFPGNFITTVASNVPGDLAPFASMGPVAHAIAFIRDGMIAPDTITISAVPTPNGMEVRFNDATPTLTLGDIVTALNNWAAINLTIGGPITALDNPGAAGTLLNGFFPFTQQALPPAGSPESFVSKIQGASGIKTQNWV